jgi:hypothetical protein
MSRLTCQETSRLQAGQQIQRHWLERCRPKGDPMAEFLLVLGIIEDLDRVRVLNGTRRDSGAAFGQGPLRIGNGRGFPIHSPRQGKT